jgi:Tol biopolymer transport system component
MNRNIVLVALFISTLLFTGKASLLARPLPAQTAGTGVALYLPLIQKPYPIQPAPGLRIAYSENFTGQLMQYDLDSGAVNELLPSHFMARRCWQFSPDVVEPKLFYSQLISGVYQMRIKNLYGAQTIIELPAAYREQCSSSWHPSGTALLAYNRDTEQYDLLDAAGVKLASLEHSLGQYAAFSPDGDRIAFVANWPNRLIFFDLLKNEQGRVVGVTPDPSDVVEVNVGERLITGMAWSPDSAKIAILVQNNWDQEDADLLLIRPDGEILANLTNGFNQADGKLLSYWWELTYSPTGRHLAFWAYNRVGDTLIDPQVFVIDLGNNNIIELTGSAYPTGEAPSFSPDGNKIIFTAGPQYGRTIVMSNPDGSAQTTLPIEETGFNARFRP